jgi:hypothetical protein
MKALTISQPYASLIADGTKWVENRRWSTSYRGPLAIHAGLGTQYLSPRQLADWPTGVILASCKLEACIPVSTIRHCLRRGVLPRQLAELGWDFERLREVLRHEHTEGPYAWILRDVIKLDPPIEARGQQGLWDWVSPRAAIHSARG